MNHSKPEERTVRRRRLTMEELAEIFHRVPPKVKNFKILPTAPLEDKILAVVALHPGWGTKMLAKSLAEQGISLSRQSIHKILVKYNLNRPSMRKAWWANKKEVTS